MSEPNRNRVFMGWLLESAWILLQLLSLILYIPLPAFRKGNRGTVFIVTDILTSPLFYLPLRSRLIRNGYSVITSCNFNPFRDLKKAARRLSRQIEGERANKCILIGHGTGALLPLALPDEGRKRVHYLMGLGGCYYGTFLFRSLSFIPAFRDVTPRSDFLLVHRMNALLFDEFYPFSAWSDEWIVPDSLLRFGQGRDLILDFPGRLNLLLFPDNLHSVIEFLNQSHPVVLPAGSPQPGARNQKLPIGPPSGTVPRSPGQAAPPVPQPRPVQRSAPAKKKSSRQKK